jgi:hypothetical protein
LLFLGWLLSFGGDVIDLFGPQGWYDAQAAAEAAGFPDGPPPPGGWSILSLAGGNSLGLALTYWGAVAAVTLFTVGVAARVTSVLTWIAVASFTANPVLDYDANALLNVLAFYLMIGCVLRGRRGRPSIGVNVAVRLLQVHLALVVLVSGLHKLQFGDWWAGVAFWYPLHPAFDTTVASARAQARHTETYLGLLSVAAYLTLAWQLAFPLFAWRQRWRLVLIVGALLGWAGMGLLYRLPWFGPAFFIGCLVYVTPQEWRLWTSRLTGFLGRRRGAEESVKGERAASLAAVGHNG